MKKATSKKARKLAKKFFVKIARQEHVFSGSDYQKLPQSK